MILKKVVSRSPKDIPMGVRRCMADFPRMRQKKKEKEDPKPEYAVNPGNPARVRLSGQCCFSMPSCKNRG